MPRVKVTRNLERFFPGLDELEVEGSTVAEVVTALNSHYAGIADYLVDERGALRKHVNIFIDDSLVADRKTLGDSVTPANRIHIIQALSGG
jgi:sulfur-carrier protein